MLGTPCGPPRIVGGYFRVEEQLPPPKPELVLNCEVPAESAGDALVEVCCTLKNIGELAQPEARLALPMPAGAKVRCVSGGPDVSDPTRETGHATSSPRNVGLRSDSRFP